MTAVETVNPQIEIDIRTAFESKLGKPLDGSGEAAYRQAYRLTMGRFARIAAKRHHFDVWQDGRFKKFILTQTKLIAHEASSKAQGAKISGAVFQKAAVTVMKKAKPVHAGGPPQHCKLRIQGTRIIDVPLPDVGTVSDGEVCSGYLAAEMHS